MQKLPIVGMILDVRTFRSYFFEINSFRLQPSNMLPYFKLVSRLTPLGRSSPFHRGPFFGILVPLKRARVPTWGCFDEIVHTFRLIFSYKHDDTVTSSMIFYRRLIMPKATLCVCLSMYTFILIYNSPKCRH